MTWRQKVMSDHWSQSGDLRPEDATSYHLHQELLTSLGDRTEM